MPSMPTVLIKGLNFPMICFGSASVSGLFTSVSESDAIEVLKECMRKSNYIDSALHYGAGLSLEYLGKAIEELENEINLSNLIISFKVGRVLGDRDSLDTNFSNSNNLKRTFDYTSSGVLTAFHQSIEFLNKRRNKKITLEDLKLMNLVVYVHDPDRHEHQNDYEDVIRIVREETLQALEQLRSDGYIKLIGIGTNSIETAINLIDHLSVDLILLAGRLTLLCNGAPLEPEEIAKDSFRIKELINLCNDLDKKLIIASPTNSVFFNDHYNYREASKEILNYRDSIKKIFDKHQKPLMPVLIRFPFIFGFLCVISVMTGPRTIIEVNENADAIYEEDSDKLLDDLFDSGFINKN